MELQLFSIAIIGLCFIQLTVVTANDERNICTGLTDGSKVADVGLCNNFFECVRGAPVTRTCSFPMFFNPITNLCADRNQVSCFKCPNDGFTDIPVDRKCDQFIRCFRGQARQHICAEGLLFDPDVKSCNIHAKVDCACPAQDDPANPSFWRDRTNCAIYFICIKGKRHRYQCQKGLHFNPITHQCDKPENTFCNGTLSTRN